MSETATRTSPSGEPEAPISSHELASGIRRHLPTIAATTVVVTVVAILLTMRLPPRYRSTASVVIQSQANSAATSLVNMSTEKAIASSTTVAAAMIRNLHLATTPEDVLSGLSVSVPVSTQVLVFSYTNSDPERAQVLAQGFADAYLRYRRQQTAEEVNAANALTEARIDALRARLRVVTAKATSATDPTKKAALQVAVNSLLAQIGVQEESIASTNESLVALRQPLEAARLPLSPSGPNLVLNAIMGLFIGVVMGTFLALGRAAFALRVRSEHDVEVASGAPVLAVIPWRRRARGGSIVVTDRTSAAADAYRHLFVRLFGSSNGPAHLAGTGRVIALVGLDDRTDTATVAANLGASAALAGRKVLLVSAATDGNGLSTIFRIPHQPGLTEVIRGTTRLLAAVRRTTIGSLSVLPIGSEGVGWALLHTEAVHRVLDEMGSIADVILVDAPPGAAAGASALIAASDAVLWVGAMGSTPMEDVRGSRAALDLMGTPSIGVVLFQRRPKTRHGRPSYPRWLAQDVAVPDGRRADREPSSA